MRQADFSSVSAGVLNSWKEIAIYVGRGVRTVQRWERDLGLPVHRPRGKQRSAVLAIPEELDYWIHNTPGRGAGELLILRANDAPPRPPAMVWPELKRGETLRAEARDLRVRSVTLRHQLMECTRRQYEGTARLAERIRSLNGDPLVRKQAQSASAGMQSAAVR